MIEFSTGHMVRWVVFSLALMVVLMVDSGCGPALAATSAGPDIAIGIGINLKSARLGSTDGMTVRATTSQGRDVEFRLRPGEELTLESSSQGPRITDIPGSAGRKGRDLAGSALKRLDASPARKSHLTLGGKRYRGSLSAFPNETSGITVINRLPMEHYLYGVIASEMLISSATDALKAQSVVARTFAVRYMDKCTKDGYNLSADTSCQVYGGVEAEDPRAIAAVDATAGQVLVCAGSPISAVYTSVCGGHTEDNEDVWDGAATSYLRGVECGFCEDSQKYSWESSMKVSEFLAALKTMGTPVSGITDLRASAWSKNGRVRLITIFHPGGTEVISAKELRRIMGQGRVLSTWFEIDFQGTPKTAYVPLDTSQRIRRLRESRAIAHRTPRATAPSRHSARTAGGARALSGGAPRDGMSWEEKQGEGDGKAEEFIRNIIQKSMSNRLYTSERDGVITLMGRGHGHGVGMCQWGTRNMAAAGRSYKEILAHYYTGVSLARNYGR